LWLDVCFKHPHSNFPMPQPAVIVTAAAVLSTSLIWLADSLEFSQRNHVASIKLTVPWHANCCENNVCISTDHHQTTTSTGLVIRGMQYSDCGSSITELYIVAIPVGSVVCGPVWYFDVMIIIIISSLKMKRVNENKWGDLKCLYKACQTAKTDEGFFTDTGVNERGENEWRSENDNEMRTVT
jgi:hypothetical protein